MVIEALKMLVVAGNCLSLKLRQLRCKKPFPYKYVVKFHMKSAAEG